MTDLMLGRAKPLNVEIMRFPNGALAQFKVRDWIESRGAQADMFDGAVKHLTDPADDGSYWQYTWMPLRAPGEEYKSRHVYIGDYIVHYGDGLFRVYPPWEFDQFFEVTDAAD